ncbi:MAG TPA: diguanylate cyclase [Solirubrobacteraceae bacterium]|nr:diguanylate cyclase [Solirubrobacteraceae bacterium]
MLANQTTLQVERAAEALLREHPDALVCGLSSNGLIVPIPGAVALWGQAAIEGRAVIDGVIADDRATVVDLWQRAKHDGAAKGEVRMLDKPSRWATLHFLDLRQIHGVLLCVIIPTNELAAEPCDDDQELPPAAPRFSTLMEDEGGIVLECDDAFTQMFGYTREELIGQSILEQIHPEDQGRVIEGWLTMLSTRRDQHTRRRHKRKDGSWMWVDSTLHNYLNQADSNHVLVEIIDVSAEMAAQEALAEREELLRRLTDGMPEGLFQLDTNRNVVYHNARLLDILRGSGYVSSRVDGPSPASDGHKPSVAPEVATLLGTLTRDAMATFETALDRVLDEGVDQDVEVDFVLPSGERRSALMSIRRLMRPSGGVSGAITSVLDVTDSARARLELERRATFDALTGVYNRAATLAAVRRELEGDGSTMTAVIYIDLDEFKPVNDNLGHAAGDELLVLVAERLKIASRGEDHVGRLGGDEFLVLLRDVPGPEVAIQVAHRICASLSTAFALSNDPVEVRASVGVACARVGAMTAEEIVKRADGAMYRSKKQGRGLPVLDSEATSFQRGQPGRNRAARAPGLRREGLASPLRVTRSKTRKTAPGPRKA